MAGKEQLVLSLGSAAYEHRLRAALWAVTAASVGQSVNLFLLGEALRLFSEGSFDKPEESAPGSVIGQRASNLGLPRPTELLSQAKELSAVRVVACSTEIALAGLSEEAVRASVDEVVALPSFWRETVGARWISL